MEIPHRERIAILGKNTYRVKKKGRENICTQQRVEIMKYAKALGRCIHRDNFMKLANKGLRHHVSNKSLHACRQKRIAEK
jgi:hypothetical protein